MKKQKQNPKSQKKSHKKNKKRPGVKKGQKITPSAQSKIGKLEFESLCKIQSTEEEIACFFGVSVDTIERWCKNTYNEKFADVFKQYRGSGRASLRRKQFQVALKGSPKMLVWLGKQYLEQSDKKELTGKGGVPIVPPVINFIGVDSDDEVDNGNEEDND